MRVSSKSNIYRSLSNYFFASLCLIASYNCYANRKVSAQRLFGHPHPTNNYYLSTSHQTLCVNESSPMLSAASFTFFELAEYSTAGYLNL